MLSITLNLTKSQLEALVGLFQHWNVRGNQPLEKKQKFNQSILFPLVTYLRKRDLSASQNSDLFSKPKPLSLKIKYFEAVVLEEFLKQTETDNVYINNTIITTINQINKQL